MSILYKNPAGSIDVLNLDNNVNIATPEKVGIVKPDNQTIFINNEGTIRTKIWAGTLAEYSQVRDVLNNDTTIIITDVDEIPTGDIIVNGVKIVSWAEGTDAELANMIAGHDAGKINIYDYWNVGDTRNVQLSAISANPNGSFVNEMDAQNVELVLMSSGYNNQNGIHFIVGQKNCLTQPQRANSISNYSGAWGNSAIRTDLNSLYYNALPSTFKSMLKEFSVITFNGSVNQTTTDKIALLAEAEIFPTTAFHYSSLIESNVLTRIEYYQNSGIYGKKYGTNGTFCDRWLLRSLDVYNPNDIFVCAVNEYSDPSFITADFECGIAPFMCI